MMTSLEAKQWAPTQGLIFTDTVQLTKKFYGLPDDGNRERVKTLLQDYITLRKSQGIDYEILDAADNSAWVDVDPSWATYHNMLCQYRLLKGSPEGAIPVFIIGGDDVIPVPQVRNFSDEEDEEEYVYSDMPYSFERSFDFSQRPYSWSYLKEILREEPRFLVSRLPLEQGGIDESSLINYFDNIKERLSSDSVVDVSKITSITCGATKLVEKNVVLYLTKSGKEISRYYSPTLDMMKAEDAARVINENSDSDMLVFVLHGSRYISKSGYFGQSPHRKKTPVAFTCEAMSSLKGASLAAGLCCWGARFVGYSVADSMLLSSLFSSTVISFMGSTNTVAGGFDEGFRMRGRLDYGELLLQTYLKRLASGYFLCEGLLRAKYYLVDEYMDEMQKNSYDTGYIRTYLTSMFEFEVYGDPFIRTKINNSLTSWKNFFEGYQKYYKYTFDGDKLLNTISAVKRDVTITLEETDEDISYMMQHVCNVVDDYMAKYYDEYKQSKSKAYYTLSGGKKYLITYTHINSNYDDKAIVIADAEGRIEKIIGKY